MDIVPAVSQKVAQNLGEGKAKRAAAVDKVNKSIYYDLLQPCKRELLNESASWTRA